MNFLRLMWLACLLAASVAADKQAEAISNVETAVQTKRDQEYANAKGNEPAAMTANTKAETPSEGIPVAQMDMPQMEVVQMALSDEELQEVMALDEAIATEAIEMETASKVEPKADGAVAKQEVEQKADADVAAETTRLARNVKSGETPLEPAAALTDEEIAEIVKMISFPADDNAEIKEAEAAPSDENEQKNANTNKKSKVDVIEPRNEERAGRALRSRGYYILAFSPLEGPVVPYSKLDIIPAEPVERSLSTAGQIAAQERSTQTEQPRMLGKKKWNSYIRRMMKQIRKGTRKIQRKTHFKSPKADVSVENFLRRLYQSRQKKKPQQSSWFKW